MTLMLGPLLCAAQLLVLGSQSSATPVRVTYYDVAGVDVDVLHEEGVNEDQDVGVAASQICVGSGSTADVPDCPFM